MKSFLLSIFIFSISFTVSAQQSSTVNLGSADSIYSKTLGENRRFLVYVPDMGGATDSFPVVYLLDGDDNFRNTVDLVMHLSSNSYCPPMIIVGISNTDRDRDLTPTHYEDPHNIKETINSGGGEKFLKFMENELIPHIESKYRTLPYRMFIGHSFGGLTVINTLLKHQDSFNSYVAIDPSMFWHNQKLLNESKAILAQGNFAGKSLYIAIANSMERGMDTATIKSDTSYNSLHIRSILTLGSYLASNSQNKLRFKQKYYDDETHMSLPFLAEYDAFRYLFDFYKFNFCISDVTDTTLEALDLRLTEHYIKASKMLGYTMAPPEELVNQLGFGALYFGNKPLAERLLKMNVLNYPKHSSVYESLGNFHSLTGDKTLAIAAYKQALSINDTAETREKIQSLQGNSGKE